MATLLEDILCKKLVFKKDENINGRMTDYILQHFRNSGKEELIIVNIGTDKVIGDCYAPLLGTLLEESDNKIKIYGTLNQPIHALNLDRRMKEIYSNHPNGFIIGVDACLGGKDNIGEIHIRNKPIQAGKGVGKDLQSVGDLSIIAIVDDSERISFFMGNTLRIGDMFTLAKNTLDELKILEKSLFENNEYRKAI